MLDGLKAKLGFGNASEPERYDTDEGFDESYYGEGYGESYDDDYADGYRDEYGDMPDDAFDPYDSTSPAMPRSSRAYTSTSPNLVSINDVRAHASAVSDDGTTSSSSRSFSGAYGASSAAAQTGSSAGEHSNSFSRKSSFMGRTTVDSSLPSSLTPEGTAAIAAAATRRSGSRSSGFNSLFEPTVEPEARTFVSAESSSGYSSGVPAHASSSSLYDSATSAEGAAKDESFAPAASAVGVRTRGGAQRGCVVIKPASYEEAERVARALRNGDAVVLAMRNTPERLRKRLLDFSFGVSAALDASVECVGDKVFALTREISLTENERANLRNQGVI